MVMINEVREKATVIKKCTKPTEVQGLVPYIMLLCCARKKNLGSGSFFQRQRLQDTKKQHIYPLNKHCFGSEFCLHYCIAQNNAVHGEEKERHHGQGVCAHFHLHSHEDFHKGSGGLFWYQILFDGCTRLQWEKPVSPLSDCRYQTYSSEQVVIDVRYAYSWNNYLKNTPSAHFPVNRRNRKKPFMCHHRQIPTPKCTYTQSSRLHLHTYSA